MTNIMTDENYNNEVKAIKQAIMESQSRAVRMISGEQLSLYFGVGLYVSEHSREGYWGSGAIEKISARLQKEMPGLRGFSAESIKKMRTFSEFWSKYLAVTAGRDANRSAATTDSQNESHSICYDMLSLQKWSAVTTEINRELNALVVVELKMGKFKSAYLGQLFGYLQILDDQVRKPHENPSIGIVLCKEANKAYAEYAVRDYNKPMGVATYKTLDDLPEHFRHALPAPEDLRKLLSENDV